MTETCKNPFQKDRHGISERGRPGGGPTARAFRLAAPTGRFHDAHTHWLLQGAKAGFFDLDRN